jgi:2-oxoglutarate dehydrogenase E1 component
MAETLAFGSLLWEGHHVRISGQDSRRGTFSHRHAMWMDQKNARKYFPLSGLKKGQGRFDVFNSPLSEYSVLGFEFGYALASPEGLVVWEAQFGDFANGAEIIIDQYIATAEQKWGAKSPLALFLPHGYEGQGAEHSSARIERFLGLAGNYNMMIVYPSTPAQMYHLIRRQVLSPLKKPLIVFTPKSLLRNPLCTSTIDELTTGHFQEIIDDPDAEKSVHKLIICTGKVYYDLLQGKEDNNAKDMAIIRVEQLYPFHLTLMREILAKYPDLKEVYWVQEEPSNMGAWKSVRPMIDEVLPDHLHVKYIGRPTSASPATGSFARHQKEVADLLSAVFRSEEQPFYEMSYHTIPV